MMDPRIIETTRAVEELVHCTEVDPYAPFEDHKELNEYKLLEGLKPYIKTQHFKRYNADSGYLESRIWLPYIRNEMFRKQMDILQNETKEQMQETERLRRELNIANNYNYNLQKRIDNYNKLPWWKKWYINV